MGVNREAKRPLIHKIAEHRPSAELESALGKKKRGSGIYALYKGKKLYYVGLATASMRSRIRQHARSKQHAGKWSNFSIFQIKRLKHLAEIETLLIRITHPPGNVLHGRFRRERR